MSIHRIEVATINSFPDSEGLNLLHDIKSFGITSVKGVRVIKIYKLEGIDNTDVLQKIINNLLVEALWQEYALDSPVISAGERKTVEIALNPGVMDTEIESILRAVKDLGIQNLKMAGTGKKYIFDGNPEDKEIDSITEKLLMNKIIQHRVITPEKTLFLGHKPRLSAVIPVRNISDEKLMELSRDKLWLALSEMKILQKYFNILKRDPTDVELETLAQTWSEHCNHKTFRANLKINNKKTPSLMSRIKDATRKVNSPRVISVFHDNSGVVDFYGQWAICGKVETHNSPSAIEPYGGAMTGSGGVFRDIAGTGKGAKVIASTDIFCFAPYDLPPEEVPPGCIHPRRLFKEIVRGVKDYGNRMGIPTVNGSVHFYQRNLTGWAAKPSVIVGAYGLIPKKFAHKGEPKKGDLVLIAGGKTGRDGIHGATFSSGAMTKSTESISSGAVQIGNPIEEKRMFEAVLKVRDRGYIRALTDCGAGGFSSAVGEMGKNTGAIIHLEKAPLKYSGLAPWEIWVSESQERMVLAIPPEFLDETQKIFSDYNVESTVLGNFSADKKLKIFYENSLVCDLDMKFLHDGLPKLTLNGTWTKKELKEPDIKTEITSGMLKKIFSHGNICSKEPIIRQYDHEVQGGLVLNPYTGVKLDGPNNSSVQEIILRSGKGIAIAHGLNPVYNLIDPYHGACCAIDEAVRNLVSTGTNPKHIALIDNFITGVPDEKVIGELDRMVQASYDLAVAWKMPFVSGKDSLSSTYKYPDGRILNIPPVLCISAFAPIYDIKRTVTTDFKKSGNLIYMVGETRHELGGSVYYDIHGELGASVPVVLPGRAIKIFNSIYNLISKGIISSCHDISEGGLLVSSGEMCFGGECGAEIDLGMVPVLSGLTQSDVILFSESCSRFLIEVPPAGKKDVEKILKGLPFACIGKVLKEKRLRFKKDKNIIFESDITVLKKAWQAPMKEIFG
ncbi:phosphoribosylformylglycinamidine synthase subunit PurL [Candidatus Desantisbacteria bacterium]|nr:phosphoribosylformylglycinamidine synthase subunit PurL [Candidatus Desantisbacteria bacterium]